MFCCVDGGASNTRVALYDTSGNRLGLSVGGPTSLTLRGAEAWEEILAVLENVARAVSPEGDYLAQIHFGIGLAGAKQHRQRDLFISLRHRPVGCVSRPMPISLRAGRPRGRRGLW